MSQDNRTIAVYPGTFDPLTNGHVDLIRRGAALFGELIVAVGDNPAKQCLLPAEERVGLTEAVVGDLGLGNVRVERYFGLTVDFAQRVGAHVLLRGVRNGSDVHFEAQVAHTNRRLTGIETVFILPAPEYAFISSGLVRQVAREGRDVSALVPRQVAESLAGRFGT